ncbi:hypothetical protein [Tunturiibacter gelidoferens]|uniref:Uncharacterized protein n=1 Tax=Tunturiibacter gelidiferens TaxID=3069689 RepID=A0A9X0U855_9BACT|nr:hypothetical protein [Edaphobacter lichenicola]MBB5331687.1 hypothetical protein [Edaphobacter lichenicola]
MLVPGVNSEPSSSDFKDAERLVRLLIAKEHPRPGVHAQSIEYLPEEMHIKLSIVVSDFLGSSGLRILQALAER